MPDDPKLNYAALPDADLILDRAQRAKCKSLFLEMESLVVSAETIEARMEEIKLELEAYQFMLDAPGIRSGLWAYSCQHHKGRKTLNKEELMMRGVGKDIIDASMKLGKPYEQRTFKRVKEGEEL